MLTRIEFSEGDLLRACDLEAALAGEGCRRALHVSAVHRTRGVGLGYEVSVALSGRVVVVEPGFGYDRCGREVFSSRTIVVPAPARDGVHDLAVLPGRCTACMWLEPGTSRDELVLARFEVSGGALGEPDITERRAVRGEGGRIGIGGQQVAGLTTNDVDTAAAGFQRTPYYFVRVEGVQGTQLPSLPPLELTNPAPDGFRLKVGYAGGATQLELKWLGVEVPEEILK